MIAAAASGHPQLESYRVSLIVTWALQNVFIALLFAFPHVSLIGSCF